MNIWKVILATMVIFIAGLITGALVVWHSERLFSTPAQHPSSAPHPGPVVSPYGLRLDLLRRMQRDLNLTIDQHEQIDKILTASQERSKKIMEPVAPEIREELKKTREEFRKVLTPEQQAKFDDLLKHQQHHPEQQRRPGTGPGPESRVQTNL